MLARPKVKCKQTGEFQQVSFKKEPPADNSLKENGFYVRFLGEMKINFASKTTKHRQGVRTRYGCGSQGFSTGHGEWQVFPVCALC